MLMFTKISIGFLIMIKIRKDIEPNLHDVFAKSVPAYSQPVDLCSPTNSSPYRMTKEDLASVLKNDPWRLRLLDNVNTILDELEGYGVGVPAFLIGGGFVRRLKNGTKPNDIDGLALYRIDGNVPNAIRALAAAVSKAKRLHIDMRLCPIDIDPITMMKTTIFYSVLFSKAEGRMEIENGLILYDRTK